MTTIAYNHKDKELASDSQGTAGDIVVPGQYTKLVRVEEGWAAFCGSANDVPVYTKILNGESPEGDYTKLGNGVIVVPDKGSPYNFWFDSLGNPTKEKLSGSWALGSGREFALGAMAVGASAKDAVMAAIKYDIYSGGKVVVKKRGESK